jgi:hypothetical protein
VLVKGDAHLHHLTYQRQGNELPEDVQLICLPCHSAAHHGKEFLPLAEQIKRGLLWREGNRWVKASTPTPPKVVVEKGQVAFPKKKRRNKRQRRRQAQRLAERMAAAEMRLKVKFAGSQAAKVRSRNRYAGLHGYVMGRPPTIPTP